MPLKALKTIFVAWLIPLLVLITMKLFFNFVFELNL